MGTTDRILGYLKGKKSVTAQALVEYLSITRQAVNKHLKGLIEKGLVVKTGRTKGVSYRLGSAVAQEVRFTRKYSIVPGLAEDKVFKEAGFFLSLQKRLRKNVYDIVNYAFTEILNNAIDHSRSDKCEVLILLNEYKLEFRIRDFGIGIFHSIFTKMALSNEYAAIGELLKGKTTTMQEKHSGEGVFFSSKAGDVVAFRSHKIKLTFNNKIKDLFVDEEKYIRGTEVFFVINHNSRRNLTDIFMEYAPREFDFQFDRTRVLVRLFQEKYVSRSEAKRMLYGLDKFKEIVLDFKGVKSLGQGFVDEVFRVFRRTNPKISVITENVNPAIAVLLKTVVDNKK